MIPASYLYRDIFTDQWGDPRHPGPAIEVDRPTTGSVHRKPLPLVRLARRGPHRQ